LETVIAVAANQLVKRSLMRELNMMLSQLATGTRPTNLLQQTGRAFRRLVV
jgi:hypothetical protein